ncbi:MAG: hypothetical protein AB1640_21340, partial [bacterium]
PDLLPSARGEGEKSDSLSGGRRGNADRATEIGKDKVHLRKEVTSWRRNGSRSHTDGMPKRRLWP